MPTDRTTTWAVAGLLNGRYIGDLAPFALELTVDTDDRDVLAAVELAARENGITLVRVEPDA